MKSLIYRPIILERLDVILYHRLKYFGEYSEVSPSHKGGLLF